MKNRCEIWASVATDVAAQCSVDATHDIAYVMARVEQEGDAFLQVTLPRFAKDLEDSLEHLVIPADNFAGFHRRRRLITIDTKGEKFNHGVPVFLGNFMRQIFDDSYTVSWDEYLSLQTVVERLNSTGTQTNVDQFLPPVIRTAETREDVERMAHAITAVRQLCLMFGKEKEQCSDSDIERAVEGYLTCEEELMHPFSTEA